MPKIIKISHFSKTKVASFCGTQYISNILKSQRVAKCNGSPLQLSINKAVYLLVCEFNIVVMLNVTFELYRISVSVSNACMVEPGFKYLGRYPKNPVGFVS